MHICIHIEIRRPRFDSWVRNIPWRRDGLPTPVFSSFPSGSNDKESTCSMGDMGSVLGWEDPLEEGMATHSSIPAWRIPWTEESSRLQSIGWQRVGHDWTIKDSTAQYSMEIHISFQKDLRGFIKLHEIKQDKEYVQSIKMHETF